MGQDFKESGWLVARAVVRGKSHIDDNTPCQDYCATASTIDGQWLVAVVCDGAGSAARAERGARFVAETVVQGLIGASGNIAQRGPGAWLKDRLQGIIIDAREKLRGFGNDIRDYNCTMVGVAVGPTGGFFFHIGDGAAIGSKVSVADGLRAANREVTLWNNFILSEPENGEHANETFFVTEDDWDRHLRWQGFPEGLDIIALMSDGAMPFIVHGGKPLASFIDPLISLLLRSESREQRDGLLEKYLASPETYRITGDDKTLFIALRHELRQYAGCTIVPTLFAGRAAQPAGTGDPAGAERAHTEAPDSGNPSRARKAKPPATTAGDDVTVKSRSKSGRIAIVCSSLALVTAILSLAVSLFVAVTQHRYASQAAEQRWVPAPPTPWIPMPFFGLPPVPPDDPGQATEP